MQRGQRCCRVCLPVVFIRPECCLTRHWINFIARTNFSQFFFHVLSRYCSSMKGHMMLWIIVAWKVFGVLSHIQLPIITHVMWWNIHSKIRRTFLCVKCFFEDVTRPDRFNWMSKSIPSSLCDHCVISDTPDMKTMLIQMLVFAFYDHTLVCMSGFFVIDQRRILRSVSAPSRRIDWIKLCVSLWTPPADSSPKSWSISYPLPIGRSDWPARTHCKSASKQWRLRNCPRNWFVDWSCSNRDSKIPTFRYVRWGCLSLLCFLTLSSVELVSF